MVRIGCVFVSSLTMASTGTNAATGTVSFTGTVLSLCSLAVSSPGIIAPDSSYYELSSDYSGGTNGTVLAVTTGTGYSISTEAPSSFQSAPSGGNSNVSFDTSYSATGVTSIPLTVGTIETQLNVGLSTVAVHLSASKSDGTFPAGAYTAEVVVRCE